MEQIWENFFLNASREQLRLFRGFNILAAESFLHLAVPTEAWQVRGPQGTCCVPQALEHTV